MFSWESGEREGALETVRRLGLGGQLDLRQAPAQSRHISAMSSELLERNVLDKHSSSTPSEKKAPQPGGAQPGLVAHAGTVEDPLATTLVRLPGSKH